MEEREQEALRELGAARVGEIHCITIIGQVEGHVMLPPDTKTTKYEHIMPLLAAVEETEDIRALLILLNTVGGDIEAGLCLAEMIAGMSKPTASVVLGGGHSIGVPLAVAADRSFIVPSAAVTIHPVRLTGVVIGVPQTYDYISRISDRIVRFITGHSHITPERFTEYMMRTGELTQDIGSVLDGQEAVRSGLIDQLGGLSDALEYLHRRIEKRSQFDFSFLLIKYRINITTPRPSSAPAVSMSTSRT